MSSDDDTIVHDDIPCPSYDQLLQAADKLEAAEALALRYRQYASTRERQWFYESKDAAYQAVKDACATGKTAEAHATADDLNNPNNAAFAYKTLRLFTRFALLSIQNFNARQEYITSIAKYAGKYAGALAADGKLAAERAVALRNSVRKAFMSKTSSSNRWFANVLKSHGHNFTGIMEDCLQRLYPGRTMKQLSEAERANVFASIVNNSGRSNFTHDLIFKAEGAIGWAVIIATLGLLVYDIIQAETDFKTKVKELIADGAELGAVWYGAAAAEAYAIATFGEAATFTVMLFGLVGGIIAGVGAMVLVTGLTALFEKMFTTTSHQLWQEYLKTPLVYKVELPRVVLDI
ncbi:unnamed protein product [Somion occarium]|uniref:Uncharacterized protein n=1 Tax=Somion occarium TaxID=3059160 RepID=A0ABP1E848_9APHY